MTFTATIMWNGINSVLPTGTVQFSVDGTTFGAPVAITAGKATITDSALSSGSHTVTASYSGDSNFGTSSGFLNSNQVVNQASTTTTLSSSPNPSNLGQTVTFTATVMWNGINSVLPTGTVQFAVDGIAFGFPAAISAGKATITDSALSVGTHTITASYSGDSNFAMSSGTLSGAETVNPASTTTAVTASPIPLSLGQTVTFTAAVTSAAATFDNGGTVQFAVDGSIFGPPAAISAGMATITNSALSIGTHTITAAYSGDSNFGTSSGTLSGGLIVNKASTTTAVSSAANPSNLGQTATFTATVTAGSGTFDNGGTVQFAVDGNTFGTPVSLGAGTATITDSVLSAGTHTITALYSGDSNFATSSGTLSGGETVNQANTTTAVSSSPNSPAYGQTVTFTATVTWNGINSVLPTGTVQFAVDSTAFGAPAAITAGKATINDSALSTGAHTITALYSGDSNFGTSSGTLSGGQTVNQASTTTAVSSSVNPSGLAQTATFTATVTWNGINSVLPTGTVQFSVDGTTFGTPAAITAGKATINDAALSIGTHTITAVYSGDSNFGTSSGTLSGGQTVTKASTTTAVNSSLNPSALGQTATFTATVAPGSSTFDNGGTVQFTVDGSAFGAAAAISAGKATITDSALSIGTHTITASYSGDSNFATSSATLSGGQTVNKASTTTAVISSSNPSNLGQTATFTATVTPGSGAFDNGGTVQFSVDGSTFGTPAAISAGKATITDSALSGGMHTITALYNGDSNFGSSSGTLSGGQTVNQASTTTAVSSSLIPSVYGQTVTFTATVTWNGINSVLPTGTVQFAVDGSTFGAPAAISAGKATMADSVLSTGKHTITAVYSGDGNFATSSATLSGGQTVNQASTTTAVSSTPNPSAYGQTVTFTATVTPGSGSFDNGGTVQFAVDGSAVGAAAAISTGKATMNDSALSIGTHTITAVYSGDSNFGTSSGTLSGGQAVNQASTTTAVNSSPSPSNLGQTVTFTATVIPGSGAFDNGGTVQFAVDGSTFGAPAAISAGTATITDSALSIGTHTITASYSGDSNFATSSGTLSGGQTVNQASTTTAVSSSVNPSGFAQTVTFTATITPGSATFDNGGTVQFAVDGSTVGVPAAISAGKATITDSILSAGTHTITALYSGDSNFATSSGTLSGSQTVNQASTTTAVSSSVTPSVYGQTVTFTATVTWNGINSVLPTGTVQFAVDGSAVGAPTAINAGKATINDSALSTGTHTLTASYSGDGNFGSSSGTFSGGQTVNQASTTTAVSSSRESVGLCSDGNLHGHGNAWLGFLRQRRHRAVRRGRQRCSVRRRLSMPVKQRSPTLH